MDRRVCKGEDCSVGVTEVENDLLDKQQKGGRVFCCDASYNAGSGEGCMCDFQGHHHNLQTALKDYFGGFWVYLQGHSLQCFRDQHRNKRCSVGDNKEKQNGTVGDVK